MTRDDAHAILSKNCSVDIGRFYGAAAGLALGAGLIYSGVRCPTYDADRGIYLTVESPAYVMTHECDVDDKNDRAFGDFLVVCPLIPVGDFVEEHAAEFNDEERLRKFLEAVASREVNRLIYLPPGPNELSHGALAYLNTLTHAHVSAFNDRQPLAAVSGYGLSEFDRALERHFRRPKSEALALMPTAALSQ